jgi:hypothetical protein
MSSPNYELKYLNIRGIGEPIRLILHHLEIPFKDTHIDLFEEWPIVKQGKDFLKGEGRLRQIMQKKCFKIFSTNVKKYSK